MSNEALRLMRRGACAPLKICGALRRGCVGAFGGPFAGSWVAGGMVSAADPGAARRLFRFIEDGALWGGGGLRR